MTGAVLVTRPAVPAAPLLRALDEAGFATHAVPTVAFHPIDPANALRPALADLGPGDWLVVTSPRGAAAVAAELIALAPWRRPRIGVIGRGTCRALARHDVPVNATAAEARPDALVGAMTADDMGGRRVVLARSDAAGAELPRALRAAGARVREVVAYRTLVGPGSSRRPLRVALRDPATRSVLFASGSALRGALLLAGSSGSRLAELRIVTIGPATSAVVRDAGLDVAAEAARPDVTSQLAAIRYALAGA